MIEFIHPVLRNYRLGLFEKLQKQYSIKFIFSEHREGSSGLGIPQSWNYEAIDISQKNSLLNWLRLAKVLFTDNYDLILTSPAETHYSLLALLISKLRFKRIVFWGESWYWRHNSTKLRFYYYVLIKWMLEQGDTIIATGEKQCAFYTRTLGKKSKVFYAPKYVVPYKKRDVARFVERLALEDRRILGKKIILYMSKIVKRKGLDYLIRAFRLLEDDFDDVYLIVVGSGEFEGYCRNIAKEIGVKNVLFKGYVSDSDIELYHNLCDVLVLPSIFLDDYPEPNGYVLYESMSVGKPLVVTDAVGAAPEFVRDGVNGFVVKNRESIELAGALSRILVDERLAKKMGEKSKEIFGEKVSLKKQSEAFKNAIDFALGKGIK